MNAPRFVCPAFAYALVCILALATRAKASDTEVDVSRDAPAQLTKDHEVEQAQLEQQAKESAVASSRALKPVTLAGLVTGGVGVALLSSGAAFAFMASARWSDARLECPTHEQCSPGAIRARDSASDYAMLANVGLIAGGVLTALGVTLVLTSRSRSEPSAFLSVAPTGIGLSGRY